MGMRVLTHVDILQCVDTILLQSRNSSCISTTVLICSSREDFQSKLLQAVQEADDDEASDCPDEGSSSRRCPSIRPTVALVDASTRVKTIFLSSIATLLAHLSTWSTATSGKSGVGTKLPNVWILGVIGMHENAFAKSAQSLSRSFASIFEAASRANVEINLVEFEDAEGDFVTDPYNVETAHNLDVSPRETGTAVGNGGFAPASPSVQQGTRSPSVSKWDTYVPLLDSSTKTFGVKSEARGEFLGRTVRLRDIAAHWFVFTTFEEYRNII